MKIAIFCNYLNLHLVALADELYNLLGDDFVFVSTSPLDERFAKGGEDYSIARNYCLRAFQNEENRQTALKLAQDADACIFGSQSMEYAVRRATTSKGFAIEGSERWLKRGWGNYFSPRLLLWQWHYHTKFHRLPWYKIGSGAFTAIDDYKLHSYRGREYKWGYFIPEDKDFDVEESLRITSCLEVTPIMWCGRFLTWKHPELPIQMAAKLKAEGYSFHIDYYGDEGSGVRHERVYPRKKLEELIKHLNVEDCVKIQGHYSNKEIQEAMRSHSIFLFTSDRREGWGVVANEAMVNGCCLVGSDEIGSIPYLIRDGVNGCVFRSGSVDSLCQKVKFLLDNPERKKQMARKGYYDITTLWSPRNAAKSLVTLIDDLMGGSEVSIKEGPCSKAELIKL